MFHFLNDYSESAHPDIITAMQNAHLQQHKGYGFDEYSERVRDQIKSQLNNKDIAIHFGITGTQANLVCIDAMLSPIDGIVACDTGHIAVNEAGAIEATGHKVILAESKQGKLTIEALEKVRVRHSFTPHVVRAKAVYISNTTELGTVYTYEELKALSDYCRKNDMYLFMDGARLGAAIAHTHSNPNERTLTFANFAELTDIFWFGGTKMGAMFGEILIIPNEKIATDFNIYLKRHGGLMAKGYLLGLQFEVLLKDDKYLELCLHANAMAQKLSQGLQQCGIELFVPTQSNQVFAILPQGLIQILKNEFDFYEWEQLDNGFSISRLVTSWATPESQVDRFIEKVKENTSNN
ncbi:threonine aldolase family protein [Psychrobacter sanguinis]|uniref:threonine aldolase family protein n=1 Tax=Psychrobacter sanguinis TaxID=861445 RepID=UPI001917FE40|nr:aminotransferase class I/II-fold pyridoxal phosphate-dependent enzyme [Psychrobacter sanguinis]MCC3308076.1 aminotransferase class I/II-fold pyridoxal phosphate-dependent enzyme [Psychrobacter sanguinis]UEC25360.1 aminotransferase class I/II-fold pyridoxal phosphate-dependent enzyme [Psychrobacter sanguinis]